MYLADARACLRQCFDNMNKLLAILLTCASVYGTDFDLSTIKPQTTDSQRDMFIRMGTALWYLATNNLATNSVRIDSGSADLSVSTPLPVVGLIGRYNFAINRDTTAGGIAAGDVLAPEIVWPNVGLSATNAVTLAQFVFVSGDATTTNDFRLHVCRAPITWGETNAEANLVWTELSTNLIKTIDSTDSTMGKWSSLGKTNRVWQSYPLSIPAKPATNSLFLYFENATAITNVNGAYGTFTYWQ